MSGLVVSQEFVVVDQNDEDHGDHAGDDEADVSAGVLLAKHIVDILDEEADKGKGHGADNAEDGIDHAIGRVEVPPAENAGRHGDQEVCGAAQVAADHDDGDPEGDIAVGDQVHDNGDDEPGQHGKGGLFCADLLVQPAPGHAENDAAQVRKGRIHRLPGRPRPR